MTKYASMTVADDLVVAGRHLHGFHSLPPEEAFRLHVRLVEAANDCGCRTGALATSLALTVYLLQSIAVPLLAVVPNSFTWWEAALVLLGGALVGKTFGVFQAKRRFDEALRDFDASRARTTL